MPLRFNDGSDGDVVQVVKQLFDIGMLFDAATDGAEVAETYRRAHTKEVGYRGGTLTLDATLDDTLLTCAAASPFKAKIQAKFDDYPLLKRGYVGMQGHLTQRMSEEDFRRFAARAAVLAAHIKTKTPIDFTALRYTGTESQNAAIKAATFNNTAWDWLDGMKQINPAAYYKWMVTRKLVP